MKNHAYMGNLCPLDDMSFNDIANKYEEITYNDVRSAMYEVKHCRSTDIFETKLKDKTIKMIQMQTTAKTIHERIGFRYSKQKKTIGSEEVDKLRAFKISVAGSLGFKICRETIDLLYCITHLWTRYNQSFKVHHIALDSTKSLHQVGHEALLNKLPSSLFFSSLTTAMWATSIVVLLFGFHALHIMTISVKNTL
nr:unnamed protein product [Callosobruchus chinensis]